MLRFLKSILFIGIILFPSTIQVFRRPDITHESQLPAGLNEHYAIELEGHTSASATNFTMRLQRYPEYDGIEIPLHMIFHLDTGEVHVNSLKMSEKIRKPEIHKCELKADQDFFIKIVYETDHYLITVNRKTFTFKSVVTTNVGRCLTVFTGATISRAFWFDKGFDKIPFGEMLPENFQGVIIVARTNSSEGRFDINLLEAPSTVYKNIPMHLAFRFYDKEIAANSAAAGGGWYSESVWKSPVKAGEWFGVHIFDDGKNYQVNVNDNLAFTYTPQIDKSLAKYLAIVEEVEVADVFFYEYRENKLYFNHTLSKGFHEGATVEVSGVIGSNPNGLFEVDLLRQNDIAIHVNPRQSDNRLYINYASNAQYNRQFQEDHPFPFKTGDKVNIKIVNAKTQFEISINNGSYTYPHYVSHDDIDRLQILGDFVLLNVNLY